MTRRLRLLLLSAALLVGSASAQDLLPAARAGLAAAPAELAPYYLSRIALRESGNPALADWNTAFQQALALPPGGQGGDPLGEIRDRVRAQVESDAVSAMLRAGRLDDAVALAQRANVRRAPLYDAIIATLAVDSRASAARMSALLQQCQDADGSYPYRGVAAMIHSTAYDAAAREALVDAAYQAAANESDTAAVVEAIQYIFSAGHAAYPASDPALSTTLQALIPRVAGATDPTSHAAAARMLTILTRVDPKAAQTLVAQHPALARLAGPVGPQPQDTATPASAAAFDQLLTHAQQISEALAARLQSSDPSTRANADSILLDTRLQQMWTAAAAYDYAATVKRAQALTAPALQPLILANLALPASE